MKRFRRDEEDGQAEDKSFRPDVPSAQHAHASHLLPELWITIFKHLNVFTVPLCRQVSTEWRALASDGDVWRPHVQRYFGCTIPFRYRQRPGNETLAPYELFVRLLALSGKYQGSWSVFSLLHGQTSIFPYRETTAAPARLIEPPVAPPIPFEPLPPLTTGNRSPSPSLIQQMNGVCSGEFAQSLVVRGEANPTFGVLQTLGVQAGHLQAYVMIRPPMDSIQIREIREDGNVITSFFLSSWLNFSGGFNIAVSETQVPDPTERRQLGVDLIARRQQFAELPGLQDILLPGRWRLRFNFPLLEEPFVCNVNLTPVPHVLNGYMATLNDHSPLPLTQAPFSSTQSSVMAISHFGAAALLIKFSAPDEFFLSALLWTPLETCVSPQPNAPVPRLIGRVTMQQLTPSRSSILLGSVEGERLDA